jgi:hypothetical protein
MRRDELWIAAFEVVITELITVVDDTGILVDVQGIFRLTASTFGDCKTDSATVVAIDVGNFVEELAPDEIGDDNDEDGCSTEFELMVIYDEPEAVGVALVTAA